MKAKNGGLQLTDYKCRLWFQIFSNYIAFNHKLFSCIWSPFYLAHCIYSDQHLLFACMTYKKNYDKKLCLWISLLLGNLKMGPVFLTPPKYECRIQHVHTMVVLGNKGGWAFFIFQTNYTRAHLILFFLLLTFLNLVPTLHSFELVSISEPHQNIQTTFKLIVLD